MLNKHKWFRYRKMWRKFLRRKLSVIGLAICVIGLFAAILGSCFAPYDPNALDVTNMFAPPSTAHIMGTDELGRDVFSRIIYGAQISVLVGVVSVAIAMVAGTLLGLISGYWTG